MDFKDLIAFRHTLSGDIYLIWGVHTTVIIALVGWLLNKQKNFQTAHKVLATLGYSLVAIIVVVALIHVYNQLQMLSVDIACVVADKAHTFANGGYLESIIDTTSKMNYTSLKCSLWRSIPIVVFFYVLMLFAIWSDWLWKKFYISELKG